MKFGFNGWFMNANFINFIESKLDDVNDKIQILSDYVESLKKKFPDVRKMSIEELLKLNVKNFNFNCAWFTIGDGSFDNYDKTTIDFHADDGYLYSVKTCKLKDKYGYTFTGNYTNGAYNIGEYGEKCNTYTCLLNSNDDKEFRKFLLDNNLEILQKNCFCVKCEDYYVLKDCCDDKREIFKTFIVVDGVKYSRYISKVKIFKNGEIERID